MKKSTHSVESPFLDAKSRKFQFGLGTLLIAMIVFSIMSACLLWASRLPLITDELNAWMGTVPSTNKDGTDRGTQLMFLLFCYSAPLLMAATLNIIVLAVRSLERASKQRVAIDDERWTMEK